MDAHDDAGLEIRGPAVGLLDEPLRLHARGAGPDADVMWQARHLDDDARVWRATTARPADLLDALAPAKAGTGAVAALSSLRPVSLEVRVQAPDGRAATRTLTRRLAGEGVRVRRWRDGLAATLHLPAAEAACATVLIDATAGRAEAQVAALAASLLASRGALVLAVAAAPGNVAPADQVARAGERLAAVPAASTDPVRLRAVGHDAPLAPPDAGVAVVSLPPGVGARDRDAAAAPARAVAWDALLAQLGAVAR
jgi:hypothetical protein